MAEISSIAEQALRKLEDQLTCGVCLDFYTDPKLLQCFHVFCKQCLERLVVQDRQGLSLCCPNCRRSMPLPPASVSGLPTAFYLNHLFEVRDTLEKVKEPQKTQCDKCKENEAINFCRNCGQFICQTCSKIHQTWDELSSHEVVSIAQVCSDVANLVPPKKETLYCSKHKGKELELYCETCGELICHNCTIRLHQGHQYDLVSDTFERHKNNLIASLKPIEQQLEKVDEALKEFDTECQQITDQQEVLAANIRTTIRQLQEALEVRETELVDQLNRITQQKLKSLAAQREQVELVQAQLSSCLNFVKESLRTGGEGEILAMKKPVMKQLGEITAEFKPDSLVPQERANIRFSASTPELTQACQHFGQVYTSLISPERCYATGKGLEVATIGEQATAILHIMDTYGKECDEPLVNTTSELVSISSGATVKCAVQRKQKNQNEISYWPIHRGRYQLHIKVKDVSIRGSPFGVVAIRKFGTPIKTIAGVNHPHGVTINLRREIMVAEEGRDCISSFNANGEKIGMLGTKGSSAGLFNGPRGITVDANGNLLVVDGHNYRIQKFSMDGQFLGFVGKNGKMPLEFAYPTGIGVLQDKVIVCDSGNHRIQVLNADLTFSSSFGSVGSGDGQFRAPWDVAFDSKGNVYITDFKNDRIQVFTAEGKFLRKFGKKGSGNGELYSPTGISIDSNDVVYVADNSNHRVSMFTCEGRFLRCFGTEGEGPGQFSYCLGIAVDRDGLVLVCDFGNNRIQIF